jgi:hypothetical protein
MNIKSFVAVACFLPGWAKDLSAPLYMSRTCVYNTQCHHIQCNSLCLLPLAIGCHDTPPCDSRHFSFPNSQTFPCNMHNISHDIPATPPPQHTTNFLISYSLPSAHFKSVLSFELLSVFINNGRSQPRAHSAHIQQNMCTVPHRLTIVTHML